MPETSQHIHEFVGRVGATLESHGKAIDKLTDGMEVAGRDVAVLKTQMGLIGLGGGTAGGFGGAALWSAVTSDRAAEAGHTAMLWCLDLAHGLAIAMGVVS